MKLFGREGSKEALRLEGEVNAWLEQRPGIEVVEIRHCASGGSLQDTKLYVSV